MAIIKVKNIQEIGFSNDIVRTSRTGVNYTMPGQDNVVFKRLNNDTGFLDSQESEDRFNTLVELMNNGKVYTGCEIPQDIYISGDGVYLYGYSLLDSGKSSLKSRQKYDGSYIKFLIDYKKFLAELREMANHGVSHYGIDSSTLLYSRNDGFTLSSVDECRHSGYIALYQEMGAKSFEVIKGYITGGYEESPILRDGGLQALEEAFKYRSRACYMRYLCKLQLEASMELGSLATSIEDVRNGLKHSLKR